MVLILLRGASGRVFDFRWRGRKPRRGILAHVRLIEGIDLVHEHSNGLQVIAWVAGGEARIQVGEFDLQVVRDERREWLRGRRCRRPRGQR